MPTGQTRLAEIRPLLVGRLTRVLFGLGALAGAVLVALQGDPATWLGAAALGLLGLSFLIGGLAANPGCELSALPNLVLPPDQRIHFL